MERLERITIDPAICLGQPTIRSMRITVSVVLKMLAGGASIEQVLDAYPEFYAQLRGFYRQDPVTRLAAPTAS